MFFRYCQQIEKRWHLIKIYLEICIYFFKNFTNQNYININVIKKVPITSDFLHISIVL